MSRASNRLLLALSGAAFAALAGLVASGALDGFDQWACDHLMPLAGGTPGPPSILESLVPLFHALWHPAGVAVTQIVTLPGQVLISFALVAAAAWKCRVPAWIVAWFGSTAVEFGIRQVLTRPTALYRGGVHLTGFDSSWPSGHALRCALVAAALAAAWPRARAALAAWLAVSVVLLEIAGFHTPTDVAGGLLLALFAWRAAGARPARALREA